MCMWEGVSVFKHVRRWRLGNPAVSGGGRLARYLISWFCSPDIVVQILISYPHSDFIYTDFVRGRALNFIYTAFLGRIYHYTT